MQDLVQHLRDSLDCEPSPKRHKTEETQGATHGAQDPGSAAPDGSKVSESRACPLKRVVVIDSTWNQVNKIVTDERLRGNCWGWHLCTGSRHRAGCVASAHTMSMWACRLTHAACFSPLSLAPGRAEDQEDVFLAPPEGQTGKLPGHH